MSNSKPSRETFASDFVPAQHTNAIVLGDAAKDNTMTAVLALGMEVWTMRRRMHVMESVMAQHGVPVEKIETYVPTPAEQTAWKAERDGYLKRVFGVLSRSGPNLCEIADGTLPASKKDSGHE